MNVEMELIISVLEFTKAGPTSQELINKNIRAPSQVLESLLVKLQHDGLVFLRRPFVVSDSSQRVRLAIRAISLGADLERTASLLQWQEFESIASIALEHNGYKVTKNLRFNHAGRKWEIDVVGCKKPLAICIDCKHWHHGMHPSRLKKAAEEQSERTKALVDSLPNPTIRIECTSWDSVKAIPAVLSLVQGEHKFHDNVPVIPVLQLQDFLSQLEVHADALKHFHGSPRSI